MQKFYNLIYNEKTIEVYLKRGIDLKNNSLAVQIMYKNGRLFDTITIPTEKELSNKNCAFVKPYVIDFLINNKIAKTTGKTTREYCEERVYPECEFDLNKLIKPSKNKEIFFIDTNGEIKPKPKKILLLKLRESCKKRDVKYVIAYSDTVYDEYYELCYFITLDGAPNNCRSNRLYIGEDVESWIYLSDLDKIKTVKFSYWGNDHMNCFEE